MIPYNPVNQKLVKCASGCGRQIAINKFGPNTKVCVVCEKQVGLPKLSNNIVTEDDHLREAITGAPANPRARIANLQDILTTMGFSPAVDGTWFYTVGDASGDSLSKVTVHIDKGLSMAPNPQPSHVSIITSVATPFGPEMHKVAPNDVVANILLELAGVFKRNGAQAERHTILRTCDKCTERVPEYIILHGKVLCMKCSGYGRK